MARGENRQEHVLALPQGKLKLAWELYRPNFGNTITITTGERPLSLPLWPLKRKPQRQSAADLRAAMLLRHQSLHESSHSHAPRASLSVQAAHVKQGLLEASLGCASWVGEAMS